MARAKRTKKKIYHVKKPTGKKVAVKEVKVVKNPAPPTATLTLEQLESGVRRTLTRPQFLERNQHLSDELLHGLNNLKPGDPIELPKDRSIFSSFALSPRGYSCVKITRHRHLVHRVFYQWMVVKYNWGEEFNLVHRGVGKEISHKCYSGKRTAVNINPHLLTQEENGKNKCREACTTIQEDILQRYINNELGVSRKELDAYVASQLPCDKTHKGDPCMIDFDSWHHDLLAQQQESAKTKKRDGRSSPQVAFENDNGEASSDLRENSRQRSGSDSAEEDSNTDSDEQGENSQDDSDSSSDDGFHSDRAYRARDCIDTRGKALRRSSRLISGESKPRQRPSKDTPVRSIESQRPNSSGLIPMVVIPLRLRKPHVDFTETRNVSPEFYSREDAGFFDSADDSDLNDSPWVAAENSPRPAKRPSPKLGNVMSAGLLYSARDAPRSANNGQSKTSVIETELESIEMADIDEMDQLADDEDDENDEHLSYEFLHTPPSDHSDGGYAAGSDTELSSPFEYASTPPCYVESSDDSIHSAANFTPERNERPIPNPENRVSPDKAHETYDVHTQDSPAVVENTAVKESPNKKRRHISDYFSPVSRSSQATCIDSLPNAQVAPMRRSPSVAPQNPWAAAQSLSQSSSGQPLTPLPSPSSSQSPSQSLSQSQSPTTSQSTCQCSSHASDIPLNLQQGIVGKHTGLTGSQRKRRRQKAWKRNNKDECPTGNTQQVLLPQPVIVAPRIELTPISSPSTQIFEKETKDVGSKFHDVYPLTPPSSGPCEKTPLSREAARVAVTPASPTCTKSAHASLHHAIQSQGAYQSSERSQYDTPLRLQPHETLDDRSYASQTPQAPGSSSHHSVRRREETTRASPSRQSSVLSCPARPNLNPQQSSRITSHMPKRTKAHVSHTTSSSLHKLVDSQQTVETSREDIGGDAVLQVLMAGLQVLKTHVENRRLPQTRNSVTPSVHPSQYADDARVVSDHRVSNSGPSCSGKGKRSHEDSSSCQSVTMSTESPSHKRPSSWFSHKSKGKRPARVSVESSEDEASSDAFVRPIGKVRRA